MVGYGSYQHLGNWVVDHCADLCSRSVADSFVLLTHHYVLD